MYRSYGCVIGDAILSWRCLRPDELMASILLHAIRTLLRFLRWESGSLEEKVFFNGTRARFVGRSGMDTPAFPLVDAGEYGRDNLG